MHIPSLFLKLIGHEIPSDDPSLRCRTECTGRKSCGGEMLAGNWLLDCIPTTTHIYSLETNPFHRYAVCPTKPIRLVTLMLEMPGYNSFIVRKSQLQPGGERNTCRYWKIIDTIHRVLLNVKFFIYSVQTNVG